jgi:hypothetical protein
MKRRSGNRAPGMPALPADEPTMDGHLLACIPVSKLMIGGYFAW